MKIQYEIDNRRTPAEQLFRTLRHLSAKYARHSRGRLEIQEHETTKRTAWENGTRFAKRSNEGYKTALEGIEQKTLVYGDKTLMTEFVLKKGSTLPLHSHLHEQTGYLVKGHMVLYIEGEKHDVLAGDSWAIPSNEKHRADILEDSLAIEVFAPVREEYIPK